MPEQSAGSSGNATPAFAHDPFAPQAHSYACAGGQHVDELLAAPIETMQLTAGEEAPDAEHAKTMVAGAIHNAERVAREISEARRGSSS